MNAPQAVARKDTGEDGSQRRLWDLALARLCLLGMDVIWFAPLLLLLGSLSFPLVPVAGILWGIAFLWLALLVLLQATGLHPPLLHAAAALLFVVTYLLWAHALFHRGVPLLSWPWLRAAVVALSPFRAGSRGALILLVAHAYLWQRAAWATSRDLSLFDAGLAFRVELSLLLVSGSLYRGAGRYGAGQGSSALVWLFLALGVVALAVARRHASPMRVGRAPSSFSLRGLALLGAGVAVITGLALVLVRVVPGPLALLLGWLAPLWEVVFILSQVVLVFLMMVTLDLTRLVQGLVRGAPALDLRSIEALRGLVQQLMDALLGSGAGAAAPPWLVAVLEGFIVVLTAALTGGVVLFFVRLARPRHPPSAPVEAAPAAMPSLGDLLAAGVARVRTWTRLLRRYGVSQHLLAAVSVQNIYANLCRLARRRGHPRPPSHPPDVYLAQLIAAFEGHEKALACITEAYMRVHYGDRPVTFEELGALREAYRAILHSP
jgi:hypothetical protein